MRVRMLFPTLVLLSTASCDEPTRPGHEGAPAFSAVVLGSATGGGVIDLSAAAAGLDHFSFSAMQHGDGSASGQFHQFRESGGLAV
jgi:hypothetical protein